MIDPKEFWWNQPDNKKTIGLPVSINCYKNRWTVASNEETKKLVGKIGACVSGDSEEEAIERYFNAIKWHFDFLTEQRLKYQRWVPLKIGPWESIGGKWFSVFGFHVSFRYGKGMKGGWYIPFTKLNISIYSEWSTYRNWIKENHHN